MNSRFQWALECLSISDDDSFLEIGPGSGALLLLARGVTVGSLYAVESSASMFAKAESRLKQFNNVDLIHGDFLTINLNRIHVSKALAFNVNIFVRQRDHTAFRRLAECLTTKGKAGVFCQNPPASSVSKLEQMLSIITDGFLQNGFDGITYHHLRCEAPTAGVVASRI